MLLERRATTVLDAIEHLVGMQSQAPGPPYVGLWSRLADFAFDQVGELMTDRRALRIVLMRGTLHLVGARDARALRPLAQVILDNCLQTRAADLDGVDQNAARAPRLPGRERPDAVRPAGRAPSRSAHAGAGPVRPGLRQPAALPRGPGPDHHR